METRNRDTTIRFPIAMATQLVRAPVRPPMSTMTITLATWRLTRSRRPLNKRLKQPLLGVMLASVPLAAALSGGAGTAHAYNGNEQQYLSQLSVEEVPGANDIKLDNGYTACAHLRNGAQPWPELTAMSTTSGWSQEDSARVLVAATWWLCRDQNWKSDKAFSS
jgi:hypothetical protein